MFKLVLSAVAILALSACSLNKESNHSQSEKISSSAYLHNYNLPASGVALDGYCPVAYFALNKPLLGKEEFSSTYNGVRYLFVSEDARSAFQSDPEKYLPEYGGWCALGMAVDDNFPVDPTHFKIVDGRLLLFLRNEKVDALKLWDSKQEAELIKAADKNWISKSK